MSKDSGTIMTAYLTQWFPPEPAEVPLGIAKALERRGHDIAVLTGVPNYPLGQVHPGYRASRTSNERVAGLSVRRVPLVPSHDSSAIRRMTNYLSWGCLATAFGFRVLRRADVALVYASPITAAIPAMVWKRIARTPYVLLIQDIWPDSVFATGFLEAGITRRIAQGFLSWFCARAYKSAAHVVVISPGAIDLLRSRGVDPNKISLVYNWTNEDDSEPMNAQEARAKLGLPPDAFVVSYAGNHGPAQGLDVVIRAAHEIRDVENVRILMVGEGLELPALRDLVRSLGCTNVLIAGPLPHAEMPVVRAASDVQLISLANDHLFAMTMPSKVQAILASGTSAIAIAPGDAAIVVEASGAGWSVTPGDHLQLAATIRDAYREGSEKLAARGRSGHGYYRRNMSETVGGARLDDILRSAAQHPPRKQRKEPA